MRVRRSESKCLIFQMAARWFSLWHWLIVIWFMSVCFFGYRSRKCGEWLILGRRGLSHCRKTESKPPPLPSPRPVPSRCHLALFFKIPAVWEAEPAFGFSGLASPAVFLVWSTWCKSRGSATFFPRSCSNETLCFEWRFSFAESPFGKEWWKVNKSCKNDAGQQQSFGSNYNKCSFKWKQTNPFPSSFGFNCYFYYYYWKFCWYSFFMR